MASFVVMLAELREIRREQQQQGGLALLKSGEADYRDDAEAATPLPCNPVCPHL